MHRVKKQIHATKADCMGLTGNGVTVAILDTGISMHPDLIGKVLEFRDFVDGKISAYDDNAHGTHVAGIVAGSGLASREYYQGIAPSCRLLIGKVLNKSGEGSLEHMLQALHWIIKEKEHYHIQILNLSIGMADLKLVDDSKRMVEAIEEVAETGILVVAAAGNMGPDPMSLSCLGASQRVISVGCHDGNFLLNGEKGCESYSGRGPSPFSLKKPDIVAPGTRIISTNNRCILRNGKFYHAYTAKSGTSMSTPIVTGSLCLLLEKEKRISGENARRILYRTADDLKEPWNKQGNGMVNVRKMLQNRIM